MQLRTRWAASARPAADRDRLLAWRVAERIAERDEIEEVIGVQVADQNGIHVDVVTNAPQLGEHAVAAIEQERAIPLLHQIAAASPAGVLPGR